MYVLLFSGIPLNTKSSFYWQLTLLNNGFNKKGIKSILVSPVPNGKIEFNNKVLDNILFLDYRDKHVLSLINNHPDAIILLGYPQEFSFLYENDENIPLPPIYLWAQFSKPPILNDFFKNRVNFVPLTERTRGYCIEAGIKNILSSIPHGIPLDIYYPFADRNRITLRKEMDLNGKFVVGTVAKNIIRKRLNDVIEAFSLASKRINSSFLIIKTDKEVNNAGYNLPFLIKRYGIYDRSKIILGDFERNKMANLYNSLDIYLQLSEWEGFGIPVIESMACGVPIITNDVQGPGEIVDGAGLIIESKGFIDESGAYLSYANVEKTAEALYKLYNDRKLRIKLSKIAINLVKRKYDIDKIIDRWIKIFQD